MSRLPALLSASFCLALLMPACVVTTSSGSGSSDQPKANTGGGGEDAGGEAGGEEGGGEADKPERAPLPSDELAACPEEADGRSVLASYCTEDGKLAGQWVPVDMLKVPDDAEVIFHDAGTSTDGNTELTLAIRGADELYIRHVTCGKCRRVLGQGFSGRLSHMSAEQLRALETQLGLGEEMPVLETTETWKSFAGDPRGSEALKAIAAKAEAEAGDDAARGR